MTDLSRLKALKSIADLLQERDLAALSRAQGARSRTEGLLRALDQDFTATDLPAAAEAQVVERFGLWSANRRMALNQRYARETAAWLVAKEEAQRAFGRAEVLGRLLEKK